MICHNKLREKADAAIEGLDNLEHAVLRDVALCLGIKIEA